MDSTTFFKTVIHLASELRSALPQVCDEATCDTQKVQYLDLEIAYPDQATLFQDLEQRGVTVACQHALLKIYYERLHRLKMEYEQVYSHAFFNLQNCGGADERFHQKFRGSLLSGYIAQARKAWKGVLQEVDLKRLSFQDSNLLCESFSYSDISRRDLSGGTFAPKATRGHSPEATRILEQAFSYTDTISPAEKHRLSELTGLTPHQVVIWVSTCPFCALTHASTRCRRVISFQQ